MTHYTVNFNQTDPQAKRSAAIAEIISYLGQDKFDQVTAIIKQGVGPRSLSQQLNIFAGISGYPCRAWWEHCFPEDSWEAEYDREEFGHEQYERIANGVLDGCC